MRRVCQGVKLLRYALANFRPLLRLGRKKESENGGYSAGDDGRAVFYRRGGLCPRLRQALEERAMIDYIWTGLVALLLLGYLLFALLKPERF